MFGDTRIRTHGHTVVHPYCLFIHVAEELRLRSERFQEASQREVSLQAELSAAKAALRPLQLQTERLGEEKELLLKQKKWFEEELAHRQTALLETRKASASEEVSVLQLRHKLPPLLSGSHRAYTTAHWTLFACVDVCCECGGVGARTPPATSVVHGGLTVTVAPVAIPLCRLT